MRKTKQVICFALLFVLAFSLSGCGQEDKEEEKKIIVAGVCGDTAPYAFHTTGDNGADVLTGLDVSIAKSIADDAGCILELKDMPYDSLLSEMTKGNLDFVVSHMVPTEEYAALADFSEPYHKSHTCILVREENAQTYASLSNFSGSVLGVQQGSVYQGTVERKIPGVETVTAETLDTLFEMLNNDVIDGIVFSADAGTYYANHGDYAVAQAFQDEVFSYSAATAKGNKGLLEKINHTLTRLEEENAIDGMLSDLHDE